jgi:hypothetical protein
MNERKDNVVREKRLDDEPDANRDPISGTPGAHPVGAGLGAAGGGAAGAAIGGALGGPVGAVAGAVVGGVAGGLTGKAAGEAVNPTVEETYWRTEFKNRPYVDTAMTYEDYGPAYRYGWENYNKRPSEPFNRVESDLERGWDRARGKSRLSWERAKHATRDAWDRLERAIPGDADDDGR